MDRRGVLLRRRGKGQRDRGITGGEQLLEEMLTCGGGLFCFEHRCSGRLRLWFGLRDGGRVRGGLQVLVKGIPVLLACVPGLIGAGIAAVIVSRGKRIALNVLA